MSRIQQCYFCNAILREVEWFLKPEDDPLINYEVNACHDCFEQRSSNADLSTV